MKLWKKIRNRIWLYADRLRTKIGEKRFVEYINQDWTQSYEEVQKHWNKPESSVHRYAAEAGFKSMAESIGEGLRLCREDNVLDIGCGDGHMDSYLKEKCGRLSGFDFAKTKIEEAKERNKDVNYFVASFLEDYQKKCQNVNKVFSYSVMQYCNPKDVEEFLRHSMEALGQGEGIAVHFGVPDKDKIDIYYSLRFGVPRDTVNRMKKDIVYIYPDGSYWHDMKELKAICENIVTDLWGEQGGQVIIESMPGCYYRSNLRIEKWKGMV